MAHFATLLLAVTFGVLQLTVVQGEFVGNCNNITGNVTAAEEEVDRYGVCEEYNGLVTACNSIISAGDYIYIPFKRVNGDQKRLTTQVSLANIIVTLLPPSCLEVARKILCAHYFIPCGKLHSFGNVSGQNFVERTPPVSVCSEQCFYLQNDLCPEEWKTAIEYFQSQPDLVTVGLAFINCSEPGVLLEPLPYCCTDAGVTISYPSEEYADEDADDFLESERFLVAVAVGGGGGGCVVILIVVCMVYVVCVRRGKGCGKRKTVDVALVGKTAYVPSISSPPTSPRLPLHPIVDLSPANAYGGTLSPPTDLLSGGHLYTRRSSNCLRQLSGKLLIPNTSISLLDTVGQGEFGVVYRAYLSRWEDVVSPMIVAVKTLKVAVDASGINDMLEESVKMKSFDHPNILSLIGVCVDAGSAPYIVMPYMENGSLLSYLKRERPKLTIIEGADPELVVSAQRKLLPMCLQISKGMEYLTGLKFIHRDLAARNCMIDSGGIIKVADFGLSEDIYVRNYFRQGREDSAVKLPVRWMALESLHDGIFTEKTDVWSFGVTCWEIFSLGRTPYPGVDPFTLLKFLDRGDRLDKPANAACTEEIYSTLLSCWKELPEERPPFSELVQEMAKVLEGVAGYLDLNLVLDCSNKDSDVMTNGYDHLAEQK